MMINSKGSTPSNFQAPSTTKLGESSLFKGLNPTDQIAQQHQLRVPTVIDPTALRALELKPNMFPHMM